MMYKKTSPILLGLLIQAGLAHAAPPSGVYVKQWSHDFPGTQADSTVWNYRTDAKRLSVQKPENVTQTPGELQIHPRAEVNGDYKFTGGGVISKQAFRYGYFETRAKITKNPGWHVAFWLFAGNGATTYNRRASTEIDIFEIDSAKAKQVNKGVIGWSNGAPSLGWNTGRCSDNDKLKDHAYNAYHTYGAEWSEDWVRFYVDGKMVCSQNYSHTTWPHDKLNIWLTSIGYEEPIAADPKLNSPVRFQGVSYYVRDYYIHVSDPGYAESGGGWTDSELKGFSEQAVRQSNAPGASASWTPEILAAGDYGVFTWNVVSPTSDPAARYEVTGSKETGATVVDGTSPKQSGWVSLGTYHFAKGSAGKVVLTSSGGQYLRPSMVKFVRH